MTDEVTLIRELLIKHHRELVAEIRTQDNLSRPCPEGHWRWAGQQPVPGAAERADKYRAELETTKAAFAQLDLLDHLGDLAISMRQAADLLETRS